MDIGMQVTCQRCTQKFQMYYDTHGVEWGKLAGYCPNCSQMVTAKVLPNDNFLVYPEGTPGQIITPVPYHAGEESANDVQP